MAKKKWGQKDGIRWRNDRRGYFYRFVKEGKVYESGPFQTTEEAKTVRDRRKVDVGAIAGRKGQSLTFREVAAQYIVKVTDTHANPHYERKVIQALIVRWSGRPIFDIKKRDVLNYKDERVKLVSHATVNRELAYVSGIFSWAHDQELIEVAHNPAKGVERFTEEAAATPVPKKVLQEILERMPPDLGRWIVLLKNLGVRKGVVYKLDWSDVDMDAGTIKWASKGATGTIRMNSTVRAILASLNPQVTGKVFPWATDTVLRRAWYGAQRKPYETTDEKGKKIKLPPLGTKYRLHDLRATFASEASSNGTPTTVIQRGLGHKRIETTRRYVTDDVEAEQKMVDRVENPRELEIVVGKKDTEKDRKKIIAFSKGSKTRTKDS